MRTLAPSELTSTDGRHIRFPLHRLVSRRSAPFRPSRSARGRQDREARALPLRVRRGERGTARAGLPSAWRCGALVAGAVAAGAANPPRRARRITGTAQGTRGRDHRRSRARDRGRLGVLERDRASAASGGGRSGRCCAGSDRRRGAALPRRPPGGPRLHPHQGRPGAAGVHAVLATGAVPGRSARTAACTKGVASVAGACRRHPRKLGPRAHASGLGRWLAGQLDARRDIRSAAA